MQRAMAERNGRIPVRQKAAGLLHYAIFSAVRYWTRLGIPVSIALVTLGIFAFAHAKT
jgi:hypothetical protein